MTGDQIYNLVKLAMWLTFVAIVLLGLWHLVYKADRNDEKDKTEKSD